MGWLGGSGLSASVAATGTIAKDGATYVPQIGASLQTAPTAPPIPVNKATPFVSTTVPWAAANAAEAAAQETARYEEALARVEQASDPPGDVPLDNTVAASMVRCKAQIYIGERGGWVWAHAYLSCGGRSPRGGKLAARLQLVDPYEIAPSSQRCCTKPPTEAWEHPHQMYAHYHLQCQPDIRYRAWAHWWVPAYKNQWRWKTEGEKLVWHPGESLGWECGDETKLEATATFLLSLTELMRKDQPEPD